MKVELSFKLTLRCLARCYRLFLLYTRFSRWPLSCRLWKDTKTMSSSDTKKVWSSKLSLSCLLSCFWLYIITRQLWIHLAFGLRTDFIQRVSFARWSKSILQTYQAKKHLKSKNSPCFCLLLSSMHFVKLLTHVTASTASTASHIFATASTSTQSVRKMNS